MKLKLSKRSITRITPSEADPNKASLCPWFSSSEWEQVYEWLYSSNPDLVERGIARAAAWKARAPSNLPLVVEMTADLVECQLNERKSMTCISRGLSLSYSMAITRFINGVSDTAVNCGIAGDNIRATVQQYGIPSWVVEVRHHGTHSLLPSIGRLHTAAQFALNWLRTNYWRPQRKLVHKDRRKSRSATPISSGTPMEVVTPETKPLISQKDSVVARLTFGICDNKPELIDLLTTTNYSDLAGHILSRQLLHFPLTARVTVKGPDVSELLNFPTFTGDLAMWRKYLLKAAEQECSFKHNLACALVVATHTTDDPNKRDHCCAWLGLLLVEHYEVDSHTPSHVEVVTILDDEDQFIPGSLDWLKLLRVVKDYPGYYTHAISSLIDSHLRSSLSESVREKVLYLSHLITLSERMGTSLLGMLEGPHTAELNTKLKSFKRKSEASFPELPRKQPRLSAQPKWRMVENMAAWACTPLGVCPGQILTATCFDLPMSINSIQKNKKQRKSLESRKVKKKEAEEISASSPPTIRLSHARDSVKLF